MSKERQSKLDPHAERLDEWFFLRQPALTYEEAREQLLQDGLWVSVGRLSEWHSRRLDQRREEQMLKDIASGSALCKSADHQFANNPAPEMPVLINMVKLIVMKLATGIAPSVKELSLADTMMRTAMEYQSGVTKARLEQLKLDLQERRVALLEKKAAAYDRAQAALESAKATGGLTAETLKKIESELKLL